MSDFHLDLSPLKEIQRHHHTVSCHGVENKTVTASFSYAGNLVGHFSLAQFFVTFGVLIFYCMIFYLGYIQNGSNFPMIDYIFTFCAVFLWLVSMAAWAKALVDIIPQIFSCCSKHLFLVLTDLISLQSKQLSKVFSNTTIQKHHLKIMKDPKRDFVCMDHIY
uniref:MARVEL domain-containing protein n=1 Tax=Pseudonaja textilis TaxID=8673 RepID=A0A670Z4C7_PSETE